MLNKTTALLPTPPKVSVVIPCYNAENYIRLAINSVLMQQYPSSAIELIVVDDGSTDSSMKIVSEYPTVKVISLPHVGVCRAVDIGYRAATGQFICMVAADDSIRHTFLSRQVSEMSQGEYDWCYNTKTVVFGKDTTSLIMKTKWMLHPALDNLLLMYAPRLCYLLSGIRNPVNSGAMMIRKEAFVREELTWHRWNLNSNCDGGLVADMLQKGLRGHAIHHCGTFYRVHPGQISKTEVHSDAEAFVRRKILHETNGYPVWMKTVAAILRMYVNLKKRNSN